ncbi:MAG: oligosaccharide flippase family protein [Prevotella sp.]|nr:oligosaccharide flippase family protein [Prevotella sp.]MCM1075421.1 oligosaccharide flippase family protein [Ruminococcus sp.]
MKLMSMFSGLQMISIICSIIKMKLVALWLGTTGVGMFGIYQSVMDTTATFTDMGIRQSSVRDVAAAAGSSRLGGIVQTVRRWSMISGLLGATVLAAGAIPLGHWFFHSAQGCRGFLILAVAMFLNAMCSGEQAILQGTSRLKPLATANLYGTIGGLAVSIPMFYWWGSVSVPLSIVAYAVTLFIALLFNRFKCNPTVSDSPMRGLPAFVRLGLYMAAAAFITSLAHTFFIGILNAMTSTAEVGLVQAGDTLVVRYIGMLFVAIGMEFYPRVAANCRRNNRIEVFVNHEITLLLLCLIPLLCLFLLLREPIISLLYSSEFQPIVPFVSLAALSSVPKAISWCMAYVIVARGDGKLYILTEGLDAIISVALCLAAYNLFGLTGLGVAYIIWYIIYTLLVGWVYYRKYGLRLSRKCLRLAAATFAITFLFLAGMNTLSLWIMTPLLIIVSYLPCKTLVKLFKK